ncbi:MAG: PQQ-binding-like beta-propeller repeat protein [Planctomycetota bacterium]
MASRNILTILAVVSSAISLDAADWPHWTGPSGRNAVEEKNLPASFDPGEKGPLGDVDPATTKNVKWAADLSKTVYGCPTVANGRVFLGTNMSAVRDDKRFTASDGGVVLCLDEATGRRLWQLVAPEREDFPPGVFMTQQKWGVCSSPTVDGDRVYVVTNGDDVLCLDVHGLANGNDGPFKDEAQFMACPEEPPVELLPTDADILWRFDIPGELSVAPHDVASCSVLICGDVLYTSTSNGVGKQHEEGAVQPDAPAFIALDKKTGRFVATEKDGISARLYHTQWSSPSMGKVGDRTLIFLGGGDGVCYAFEAIAEIPAKSVHLKKVWSYDCNPPHYKLRDGRTIPYYDGDVRKYRDYQRRKKATREPRLLNDGKGDYVGPSQIIATPVFCNNRVYIAIGQDPAHGPGKGILHCIDATKTGDITESGKVWSCEEIGRTICTVAVADGLVYAADLAGKLYCFDAETGAVHWIHETKHETWGGPLVADGKLYFTTKRSFWILAAGKEKKVIFTHSTGSECAPIAANGVIYAMLGPRLWALMAK